MNQRSQSESGESVKIIENPTLGFCHCGEEGSRGLKTCRIILMKARKRLMDEFKTLQKTANQFDPSCTNYIRPSENDNLKWNVVFFGMQDSPYENGVFKLVLTFCHEYPFKPPQVKFLSKMFHPNVSPDGNVCQEIFQKNWSPDTTVVLLVEKINLLLGNPCLDDKCIYNLTARDLFLSNKLEYSKNVNDCVAGTLIGKDDLNVNQGI